MLKIINAKQLRKRKESKGDRYKISSNMINLSLTISITY